MKHFFESVKLKVFLGYVTLIVLASLIIWVIYSEILRNSGDKLDFNPANHKLIYINNILTNLYQAEGLERSYAQTGQKKQYYYYLKLMDSISLQIDTLALLVNNPIQQVHTDSIKKLLQVKRQNLKELAAIKKENSSKIRYQQAIKKISSVKDTITEPLNVSKNITVKRDTIYFKQKKKKFFERLINVFATQKKADSTLHVRTTQSVKIDSIVGSTNPADSIASFITGIVSEIREENTAIETRLEQKEQKILANDLIIMFQLRQILSDIENEELINSFQKVQEQQSRIEKATWLIILVGSIALGTVIFFLVNILKDITKSQHYRQSLEKAKAYTESLLKSKEQFMLSVTHDLKSPLSSIIGFAGLMEVEDSVSPEHQKYLQNINKASVHILKLINNLLNLARLESGKLTIERIPFNLKLLIDDIVESFRPQAQTKNIELHLQTNILPSAIYMSAPVQITQIVGNLVSNAIKFTEEGTVTVKVSIADTEATTDRVRIDVIDTGIGISTENLHLIFEEFARVNPIKKQFEGSGLGLTITQKIIKLLHGSISLESKPGEGSHFEVILPLEKPVHLPEKPLETIQATVRNEKPSIAGKKVWVIDDDETLLEMTSIILKSAGMKIQAFSDPQKAICSFTKGCTDLLIIDIQMPEINGVEVLKQIQRKNGQPIIAIAISGMNAEQNNFDGFSAYLPKPFHPQQLINVISGQWINMNRNTPIEVSENTPVNAYTLEQFIAFASGDLQSLRQILLSFIHTGRENTRLLRQYLQERNTKAISALSHKMLTLFRQMEAHDIVELLTKLEQQNGLSVNEHQFYLWGEAALAKIESLLQTIQKDENISTA